MSTPTYTVTEDHPIGPGWFVLWRDDLYVASGPSRVELEQDAASMRLNENAEALLALLVESREPLDGDGELERWANKRDALIAKITGEPK